MTEMTIDEAVRFLCDRHGDRPHATVDHFVTAVRWMLRDPEISEDRILEALRPHIDSGAIRDIATASDAGPGEPTPS